MDSDRESIVDDDVVSRDKDRGPTPSNMASSRASIPKDNETKAPKIAKDGDELLSNTGKFKKGDLM
jgi:hypothetical protein